MPRKVRKAIIAMAAVAFLLGLAPLLCSAGEGTSPGNYNTYDGLPLSYQDVHVTAPCLLKDGSGSVIVAWGGMVGNRTTGKGMSMDIEGQRFDPAGNALWNSSGIRLTQFSWDAAYPAMCEDGNGGVFLCTLGWPAVYMQHITASGTPSWSSNYGGGTILGYADQYSLQSTFDAPAMCTDGQGGAIACWLDLEGGLEMICAQRVNASGSRLWAPNGTIIGGVGSMDQDWPVLAPDGSGGAFFCWSKASIVRIQHVDAAGSPLFGLDGVVLGPGGAPALCSDGTGGAIIAWSEGTAIAIQHVDASDAFLWGTNGTILYNNTGYSEGQESPQLCLDGAGGCFVSWLDFQLGYPSYGRVLLQHVSASGQPEWPANAVVFPGQEFIWSTTLCSDGKGGVIVATDYASLAQSTKEMAHSFIQRVDGSGKLLWGDGVALGMAGDSQWGAEPIADGNGGAIVGYVVEQYFGQDWIDTVYVTHVSSSGRLPSSPIPVTYAIGMSTVAGLAVAGTGITLWRKNTRLPVPPARVPREVWTSW